MRIFFLPFAGGSKYSYTSFLPEANKCGIGIVTVELPGRGGRFKEELVTDVHALANDIFNQIRHMLTPPYAIYGHSMGALIGYLVTRKIYASALPMPAHLFFSGCGGPSFKEDTPPNHLLEKQAFINKLKELGGCPDEVLGDDYILEVFEPIIRADFQAVETYQYQDALPLNIPVTVMIGSEEHTSVEEAETWQRETTHPIEVLVFPGNHFFIFGKELELMHIMKKKLLRGFDLAQIK